MSRPCWHAARNGQSATPRFGEKFAERGVQSAALALAALFKGERMADVQIQQTPEAGSGSGAGWVWALLVLILLAVIAWFVFGGGLHRTTTARIDINTPGAPAGGGSAAGSVGSGSSAGGAASGGASGATKKP